MGLSASQFSIYDYTTSPENLTTAITETSDSSANYPSASTQTASYNNLNQLTNLSGQSLSYNANGNLLSDGQRTYDWDAENRLVGISYPAQPGKATAFTYDGLGRRATITSFPAGGGIATTTSYIWCGVSPCQARDDGNSPARDYFAEGEHLRGPLAQTYYYGEDQIGSVRRVFASAVSAPGYDYDPYGNVLGTPLTLTDFGYAGMFANADSGLALTRFRAYDPVAGRWLSRDPIGEATDPNANLYTYVSGKPVNLSDPTGLLPICAAAAPSQPNSPYQPIADITGFTRHGINQAINRSVGPGAIMDAVANLITVTPMANGTTRYTGAGAVVVLNPLGLVVTLWPK